MPVRGGEPDAKQERILRRIRDRTGLRPSYRTGWPGGPEDLPL